MLRKLRAEGSGKWGINLQRVFSYEQEEIKFNLQMMMTMMIIILILCVLCLNKTLCIKSLSLVFTSSYIHCCVSQNKKPPNQPRLRHRREYCQVTGLFERCGYTTLGEAQDKHSFTRRLCKHSKPKLVLMYASSLWSLKIHMELKGP